MVKVDVEMAAPELANTSPHSGWISGAVNALEHAGNGAAGQLVLITVLLDEVANVHSDCLLLVACFLLILDRISKHQHTL